ncbi:MAG: ribokinase [Chloroflexi bacterium RBG_16_54_18]|nr:MAG: ribokinase [Chloroflexi bacterium RBG_16_54_18]
MDLVVQAPRHPAVGETILGNDFCTFPGGKGANQAVAASRLGAQVRIIGRLGADNFGDALLNTLMHDGVDTQYISRDTAAATGVALITVSAAGQNTIVVASGANARLSIQDLEAAEAAFQTAQILVTQLESPVPVISRAIELARHYGVKTILNPAPAQPLEARLLEQIDYLIPNEHELALLSGSNDLKTGIGNLQKLGVKNLIVTLGENGAMVVKDKESRHIPAFKVEAVDTTAAGDAFVGAFAVALTQGLDVFQAVRWGNAAGALAATLPGAQPSLPTRITLDGLLSGRA